jgi:hypothetical protein
LTPNGTQHFGAGIAIQCLDAIVIEGVNVNGLGSGGHGSLGVPRNLIGRARDRRMLAIPVEGRL